MANVTDPWLARKLQQQQNQGGETVQTEDPWLARKLQQTQAQTQQLTQLPAQKTALQMAEERLHAAQKAYSDAETAFENSGLGFTFGFEKNKLKAEVKKAEQAVAAERDAITYAQNVQTLDSMDQQTKNLVKQYAAWYSNPLRNFNSDTLGIDSTAGQMFATEALIELGKQGYTHARVIELAETMNRMENEQTMTDIRSAAAQAGKDAPVLSSVGSVPANFLGSFTGSVYALDAMLKQASGQGVYETLDPNLPGYLPSAVAGSVRQSVAETIEGGEDASGVRKVLGKAGSFLYQGTLSAADNLLRMAVGGGLGKYGSLALAGMGSFQSTVQDVSARGGSAEQALVMGIASAGLEALTEKIPLDQLLNAPSPTTIKQWLKNAAVQGLTEVTEEEASFVGNLIFDAAVMGDKSAYNLRVAELVGSGQYTQEQAERIALEEIVLEAAETAATSFVSGGLMAGLDGAADMIGAAKTWAGVGQRADAQNVKADALADGMIRDALRHDSGTESHKLASKLAEKQASGKKLSAIELGTLYRLNLQDAAEGNSHAPANLEVGEDPEEQAKADTAQAQLEELNRQLREGEISQEEWGRQYDELDQEALMERELKGHLNFESTQRILEQGKPKVQTAQEDFQQEVNRQIQRNWDNFIYEEETPVQQPAAASVDERSLTKGDISYGGNGVSDGGQIRDAGAGAGEQAGSVSGGTAGQGQSADARAAARIQRQNAAENLRQQGLISPVSARQLGVSRGTDNQKTLVLPESQWDPELRQIADRIKAETDCEVVFVVGGIEIAGYDGSTVTVRGVYTQGKIIVQADHEIDAGKLADHEAYHARGAVLGGLNEYVKEQILQRYSKEEFDRVLDKYMKMLWPVYGPMEDYSEENRQAYEEACRQIEEELLADAYAGINAFGAGATVFTETVNQAVSDRGNIKQRQENGVRQTDGPPVNRDQSEVVAKYSIDDNAEKEVKKVLSDRSYKGEVLLRKHTPAILLSQRDVRDLPMTMNASHIRENIFTESEALKFGLKVDAHTNYHGLGIDLFLRVIDALDDVTLAYRGTKKADNPMRSENYFLLVLKIKDSMGNFINVPVYINEHSLYNQVFIDTNKIATVFGRHNIEDYIRRETKKNNLVRIKKGNTQTSESDAPIAKDYGESVSTDSISIPHGKVKESFSVDDSSQVDTSAETVAEESEEKPKFDRETMPRKARENLRGIENELFFDIRDALGAHRLADRSYLKDMERELVDEYLQTGAISQETMDRLFEASWARGLVIDRELHDRFEDVKKHLNTTAVTISESDKNNIADFKDFRRSAFGNLRIVNQGGTPVDTFYGELREMAPALFPKEITHPADQLVKMFEVAKSLQISEDRLQDHYGSGDYRRWAKDSFSDALGKKLKDLREVKRYLDGKASALESEKAPVTAEEAMEVWGRLKEARKVYQKAMAKNLLTEEDEILVGRLLRGEESPDNIDPEKDGMKGVLAVFEGKQEYVRLMELINEYRRHVRGQLRKDADGYLKTASQWKDKAVGLAYSIETMQRNIEDIVPDPDLAKQINEHYFEQIRDAEAQAVRMKDSFRQRVAELGLSRKVNRGDAVSEAHAVQLYGEAMDNIRVLEKAGKRLKYRDGKTLEDWQGIVADLWLENPGLDKARVENAVKEFRKIYDELFRKMNEVRVKWGYEPVNYREGYFPHFQPGDGDGILQQFGRALGIDTQVVALPTTINGLTHTFKPGIQWFGNAQERLGFNTAYDAVEGFDKYIEGIASVIHQTENIQKLRALAAQVRYRTTDEGIQEQVDDINADDRLTDEEKQAKIAQLYEHGKFSLSNFIVELDEYTNLLANKKSKLDRTVEGMIGRRFYTCMKWLEARVGANMIAGNLSSALTNFIPLTQATAQVGYKPLLSGMWQTLKAWRTGDGVVGMSSFLTNRMGSDPLVQTWSQKASSVLGKPMELIDGFVSGSIVRAAYAQNLERGMPESEAMHQADIMASRIMAERSKGGMPTLFGASNPLIKLFTQFQLEVNNQFSEIFKDIPRAYREKHVMALALAFMRYFIGAWLFNELYEKFAGRRAALDPIDIVLDLKSDLVGEDAVGFGPAVGNFTTAVLEELPFSSGLGLLGIELDGGRIPVSSAIPDVKALWDAATTEGWDGKMRWKEAKDELSKLVYVLPPFGGNQLQKIWKGVKAYIEGGSYSVDSAGNDILQYPVHNDESGDFWSLVRAMVMGKSSLGEAQEWVEDGFDSLSAKQTAIYQDMKESGVSSRDAYDLLDALRSVEETETQTKEELQLEILKGSDVAGDGRAIAFYGMLASEKERTVMDTLADMDASAGSVAQTLMYLHDADGLKGVEKYKIQADVLIGSELTEEEKCVIIGSWLGTEEVTESGSLTAYGKFLMAMKSGISTDEYLKHRAAGGSIDDLLEYRDMGLNADDASDLSLALDALKPEDGAERVTNLQKWRVCVDFPGDAEDHLTALSGVMTDAQIEKAERAWSFGVAPEKYVYFYELRQQFDANENGRYSQVEVTAAIEAMGDELTKDQQAALWQIVTGSKKAQNNPFSAEVGQQVLDAKNAN